MHYINMSTSNTAAQTYVPEKRPHDPVNHLGVDVCDWTKRLKAHELHETAPFRTSAAKAARALNASTMVLVSNELMTLYVRTDQVPFLCVALLAET